MNANEDAGGGPVLATGRGDGRVETGTQVPESAVPVLYRNHRGEVAVRLISPTCLHFGKCRWHPGKQHLLDAWDHDKQATRTFAMADVLAWGEVAVAEGLAKLNAQKEARRLAQPGPRVVCLCGSTRFRAEYARAFYAEEHAGRIVLSVPCYKDDPCCKSAEDHARLDALHLRKIDLADEVLVIDAPMVVCGNCGGKWRPPYIGSGPESIIQKCTCLLGSSALEIVNYVGESTRREIAYAESLGKPVRYLSKEGGN